MSKPTSLLNDRLSKQRIDEPFESSFIIWDCSLRQLIMSSPSCPSLDYSASTSSSPQSNNSPQRTTPGNIPSTTINQSKHEKHRKPMKSAIRNSRALPQQRQANKHNCIPSMGGSIVIKNGAGTVVGAVGKKSANNIIAHNAHPNAKSNGYISPQWGWYISTTPPTPEYHNTVGSHKGQVLSHTNNTSNHMQPQANSAIGRHWNPTTDTILEGTAPRPVFRKANPRPGGWPTVPI